MDTAVIVIDMQNGFVHPEGSFPSGRGPLQGISQVIEETRELLGVARQAGVPIVYARIQWREGYLDGVPFVLGRFPGRADVLVEGSWDAAICDALAPEAGDVIVDKRRYDAFLYTDMELVLRALGVTRLLVTGVLTTICVESTVRSAHMRDFDVYVASDCTACGQPESNENSLAVMGAFATVLPWKEALSKLLPDQSSEITDAQTARHR